MSEIKLTVLVDDFNGAEKGYVRSYGFAALIEKNNKKILFDTGTKVNPFINNLLLYGISPASVDAVILSHNHYDHTDGLPGILEKNKNLPVYIHKDWDHPASFKGFQVPSDNKVVIQKARELHEVTAHLFITNSYYSSDYGGVYEQACFIKTKSSYILICGCCHPGLNNFLKDRESLGIPPDSPLYLIGGMHGFKFSDTQAKVLNPIVKSVVLYHCTMHANIFRKQFGEKCQIGIVGKTLSFPL